MNPLRKVGTILLAMLREIFEETAYARFLARQGLTSSVEAYAAFVCEAEIVKARKPRCC